MVAVGARNVAGWSVAAGLVSGKDRAVERTGGSTIEHLASYVSERLLSARPVIHPWFGVRDTDSLPTSQSAALGLAGGVQVESVQPGSPASRAGLAPNDVSTSLDGHQVTSPASLRERLRQARPGRRVNISYLHKGRPVQAGVLVADQPTNS